MTRRPELSVVLPAYQEAASLRQLLPSLISELGVLTKSVEILVIDSSEPLDNTQEVCREHGVVHIPRRGGSNYGDAIRTALVEASGDHIIIMDADGSHNPKFLSDMWAERQGADLVIASRYIRGGSTENPAVLIAMSLFVNIVFRSVLGLKCHDVSNSLRLYRGGDIRGLTLESHNFDIVEEILIKVCHLRHDYSIKEVPFTFEKRKAGHTKRRLLPFAIGYISTLARLLKFKRQL